MLAQREVPQYAQVAAGFQKVNPQARVADVADGPLAVRDSDVIVAIGSKAFELARAQPGSAAIVAAAVLTPQPGGSHPITAVPMESRSAISPASRDRCTSCCRVSRRCGCCRTRASRDRR